jgi:uncharacterized membrane protein YebE (DUF533 family)
MSLITKKLTRKETELLTDLLMGAAFADEHLENIEKETVEKILLEVTKEKSIPLWLSTYIESFKPGSFDITKNCKELGISGGEEAKMLISLLVRITDSDDIHDMDEGSYLIKVAKAVNAPKEVYEDLTVEMVVVDDLEIEEIKTPVKPPPIPK